MFRGRFAQDQSARKFRVRMKLHVWSDFRVHDPYTTLTTLAFTRVQGCVGKKKTNMHDYSTVS